jgi:hypothetical protein
MEERYVVEFTNLFQRASHMLELQDTGDEYQTDVTDIMRDVAKSPLWANEKVPRQNDAVVAIAENYFKNVLVSSSEQTAP